MYDPHRDEFNDYDPIADNAARRNAIAAELRHWRAECPRASDGGRLLTNDTIHKIVMRGRGAPSKLDIASAREWALALWWFATSPMPYLPCGADDAYGERQDYARSHALAIWRAVGRF